MDQLEWQALEISQIGRDTIVALRPDWLYSGSGLSAAPVEYLAAGQKLRPAGVIRALYPQSEVYSGNFKRKDI